MREGIRASNLAGTGLAVWEIALIAEDRDVETTMEYRGRSRDVIEQALAYVDDHADEIAGEIAEHTADSVDELQARLSGVPIYVFDIRKPEDSNA